MLKPSECTLYSGGHAGAESFFGECAQRWGVNELHFLMRGIASRGKNVIMLNDEELCQILV